MSLSSPKPKNFSHRVANPANLRWKYILDSLIEDKRMTDRKLIDQLKECIDSLGKYPLVLEEVTHCAILIGFNANIINLMKEKVCARANGFEVKEPWNPINDLEYCTLSPISKNSEENGELTSVFICSFLGVFYYASDNRDLRLIVSEYNLCIPF